MLHKMSPARALLFGILLYAMIYLFFPVVGNYPPSTGAISYVFVTAVLLFAGATIGGAIRSSNSRNAHQAVFNFKIYLRVTQVAAVGVVFKVIDKFMIRGVSLSAGIENREILEDAGGSNIFSLIGGVLYPLCYVSLFVLLSSWGQDKTDKKKYYIVSLLLFSYPTLDSMLIGSRSLMIVNFTMLLLYGLYFKFIRINIKTLLLLPVVLCAVGLLSGFLFLNRLEYMGLDYLYSALNSVYAFTVEPNDWVLGKIFNSDDLSFLTYYSLLNTGQYFTHGLFEFFYMYDHFNAENTYGAYNFSAYYKFVTILTGDYTTMDAVANAQPRIGTFTTFLGPVFVDFGWVGPVYMFFFGFVAGRIWSKCVSGEVMWVPLYFYFVLMLVFVPVVNFFVSAQGLYTITAFLLFVLISKLSNRSLSHG